MTKVLMLVTTVALPGALAACAGEAPSETGSIANSIEEPPDITADEILDATPASAEVIEDPWQFWEDLAPIFDNWDELVGEDSDEIDDLFGEGVTPTAEEQALEALDAGVP